MQIIKLLASSLAVAGITTASPVAQDRNHTLSCAMTQDDSNHHNNKTLFQLFGRSAAVPFNSTDMQQHVVNQTESTVTGQESHKRHMAAASEAEGRPGKVPYRKFPPCYVKCFDSESITSKTSMFIGDIRDLTTYEFCESQAGWVGTWIFDHLQYCVHGECSHCVPGCGKDSGKVYEEICGYKWCEKCWG
ncbi:hypothetical protein PFICI_08672 [Pestalotiopsis fici W106-1]|uniref:Uncharacterized protein n=1 Tax=Pestalotiopsis fici (strain W106-1 / CGMCC3.15140) TaxID=1229662 RepID=W3WYG8_PESFW|nr:uncharacterized protein PFICI_08672 [Pestalotiopsis fici W106-1]ETS78819.1 hypothetical protein PFICI_08672 [Pestalotiopsis fici W106-1]